MTFLCGCRYRGQKWERHKLETCHTNILRYFKKHFISGHSKKIDIFWITGTRKVPNCGDKKLCGVACERFFLKIQASKLSYVCIMIS